MQLKYHFIILLLLYVVAFNGCKSNHLFLNDEDVIVSCQVHWDEGSKTVGAENLKSKVYINVYWKLEPGTMLDETQKIYAPYMVIIPSEKNWTYAGTKSTSPLHIVRSLPPEVILNSLTNDSKYNWDELSKERFGFSLRAKSFEQGFTTASFIKASDSLEPGIFTIYFIYYDPVYGKGWFKIIESANNLY